MLGILGVFTHASLISFTKSIAGGCSGDLFYVINFNCTIESFWVKRRHASAHFQLKLFANKIK